MNDHLETSNEQHLRKTLSKLLKTTERLNELEAVEGQIEELQTDKESMKRLLDSNSEEISDLKLSAKKLELENMALKKDVAALQKQLEEVKLTAAGADREEVLEKPCDETYSCETSKEVCAHEEVCVYNTHEQPDQWWWSNYACSNER